MEIKEFAEIVKDKLEKKTGLEIKFQKVLKNNGVTLNGICVSLPDSNISPTIYLEKFLEDYENGAEICSIIEHISKMIETERNIKHFDIEWYRNFENVKDSVAFKLINYEANKELLETVPYKKVLDLAKVYYVTISVGELAEGTILINNNHLKLWGISAEQLKEYAEENTPKLFPAQITDMAEMLEKMREELESLSGMKFDLDLNYDCNMYVATNKGKIYGAAVMCYKDVLKEFADSKGANLIILPSSIHEVLIIVSEARPDISAYKMMVQEINSTQLAREEVLSDSVYTYNRHTNELIIS